MLPSPPSGPEGVSSEEDIDAMELVFSIVIVKTACEREDTAFMQVLAEARFCEPRPRHPSSSRELQTVNSSSPDTRTAPEVSSRSVQVFGVVSKRS